MITSRLLFQFDNLKNINPVEALWPAGTMLRDEAVDIVPVDTGHLRDSITVEELPEDQSGIMVFAGAGEYDVNYACFVEFGTSNPNYPIQPYMRPAIDRKQEDMAKVIGLDIERQMNDLIRSA